MVKLLLSLFFTLSLSAKTFTVASYNVENLFDLKIDKSDYKEYKPNNRSKWNKKNFNIKLANTIKVLKDLNSDIIALQEIENKQIMELLLKKLPDYKYYSFSKYKRSSVGIGFLSKIQIIENKDIKVEFSNKLYRPILETTFKIDNYKFKIFNNHWPSKRSSESYRVKYAKRLFDRLQNIQRDYDYILVGDFNSNYNEFETIFYDKKLNDTQGITGINQVLNTTINKNYITKKDILRRDKKAHYNLWLELKYPNRFSNIYRGQNQTPDNIILPPALFDNKKISYKSNSFKTFKPKYLYTKGKINRWQIKNGIHQGYGFSDHLPIIAEFSTKSEDRNPLRDFSKEKIDTISQLYNTTKLINDVDLKDVIVLYKTDKSAIIKQKNNRAIYLYNNAKKLTEGFLYDIRVSQIKSYFGLKEIKSYKILEKKQKIKDYKNFYLDGNKIDIFDLKYQNEIVTNLEGIYKDSKLYMKRNIVKLFFKNKKDIPKQGSKIKINRAHIAYYKKNIQIIIHNKSDIDVN